MTEPKKPKKTDAERLAALKQQEAAIKQKIAQLAEKQKSADRKLDARRKIIVGAAAIAHAKLHPEFALELQKALKAVVTKDTDRELLKDLF